MGTGTSARSVSRCAKALADEKLGVKLIQARDLAAVDPPGAYRSMARGGKNKVAGLGLAHPGRAGRRNAGLASDRLVWGYVRCLCRYRRTGPRTVVPDQRSYTVEYGLFNLGAADRRQAPKAGSNKSRHRKGIRANYAKIDFLKGIGPDCTKLGLFKGVVPDYAKLGITPGFGEFIGGSRYTDTYRTAILSLLRSVSGDDAVELPDFDVWPTDDYSAYLAIKKVSTGGHCYRRRHRWRPPPVLVTERSPKHDRLASWQHDRHCLRRRNCAVLSVRPIAVALLSSRGVTAPTAMKMIKGPPSRENGGSQG